MKTEKGLALVETAGSLGILAVLIIVALAILGPAMSKLYPEGIDLSLPSAMPEGQPSFAYVQSSLSTALTTWEDVYYSLNLENTEISTHAKEKHGEIADTIFRKIKADDCGSKPPQVFFCPGNRNRMLILCGMPDGQTGGFIIDILAEGYNVTSFPAPNDYWGQVKKNASCMAVNTKNPLDFLRKILSY